MSTWLPILDFVIGLSAIAEPELFCLTKLPSSPLRSLGAFTGMMELFSASLKILP